MQTSSSPQMTRNRLTQAVLIFFLTIVSHSFSQNFSFENDFVPIVQERCISCHIDGQDPKAPLHDWTDSSEVYKFRVEMRRRLLLPKNAKDHMPKNDELSEDELVIMTSWLSNLSSAGIKVSQKNKDGKFEAGIQNKVISQAAITQETKQLLIQSSENDLHTITGKKISSPGEIKTTKKSNTINK